MIDALFAFPDEAAADAAFPPPPGERPPCWTVDGRAVLPCRVWRETSPEGAPLHLTGAWRIVTTPTRDPALEAMPGFRWAWARAADDFVAVAGDEDLECDPWWFEVTE